MGSTGGLRSRVVLRRLSNASKQQRSFVEVIRGMSGCPAQPFWEGDMSCHVMVSRIRCQHQVQNRQDICHRLPAVRFMSSSSMVVVSDRERGIVQVARHVKYEHMAGISLVTLQHSPAVRSLSMSSSSSSRMAVLREGEQSSAVVARLYQRLANRSATIQHMSATRSLSSSIMAELREVDQDAAGGAGTQVQRQHEEGSSCGDTGRESDIPAGTTAAGTTAAGTTAAGTTAAGTATEGKEGRKAMRDRRKRERERIKVIGPKHGAQVFMRFEHPVRLDDLPRMARFALYQLHDAGHESYVVGGAVRDLFLGRTPKDVDVITTATLQQVSRLFNSLNCRARVIGRKNPICRVFLTGGTVDVSSLAAAQKTKAEAIAAATTEAKVDAVVDGGGGGGRGGREGGVAHTIQDLEQLQPKRQQEGRFMEASNEGPGILHQQRVEKVLVSVEDDEGGDEEEVGEEDEEEEDEEGDEDDEDKEDGEESEGGVEAGGVGGNDDAHEVEVDMSVLEGVDAKSVGHESVVSGIDTDDKDRVAVRGAVSEVGMGEDGVSEGEKASEGSFDTTVDEEGGGASDHKRPFVLRAFYKWTDKDDVRLANVSKRDFTVNSLMYDPFHYVLYDYMGGSKDLHKRTLRSIGPAAAMFAADPPRFLRALKLSARLNFRLSTNVKSAFKHASTVHAVAGIQANRLQAELHELMAYGSALPSLCLLLQFNLLPLLLPIQSLFLQQKGCSKEPSQNLLLDLIAHMDACARPDKPHSPPIWLALLCLHLGASVIEAPRPHIMCAALLLMQERSFLDAAQHTLALEQSYGQATSGLRELRAAVSGQFGSTALSGQAGNVSGQAGRLSKLRNALEAEGGEARDAKGGELGVRKEESGWMKGSGGEVQGVEGRSMRRAERFEWGVALLSKSEEEMGEEGDDSNPPFHHAASTGARESVNRGGREGAMSERGGYQGPDDMADDETGQGGDDQQLENIIAGALEVCQKARVCLGWMSEPTIVKPIAKKLTGVEVHDTLLFSMNTISTVQNWLEGARYDRAPPGRRRVDLTAHIATPDMRSEYGAARKVAQVVASALYSVDDLK